MNKPHRLLPTATLAIALVLSSAGLIEAPLVSAKQPTIVAASFSRPKPPNRGTPGNAGRGAASRSCMALAQKSPQPELNRLNALVPEYPQEKSVDVWGLTTQEHPTLWFYVPYASSGIESIEFIVQDEQEEILHRIPVSVPTQAGIVSVSLPTSKPGLKVGNLYNWFFKVHGKCSDNLVVYVEGWIQRSDLDPAVSDRLKQATPHQQARILAEQGIWYDALTTLAQLRLAEPNNATIITDWTNLLQDGDMEVLTNQAIVPSKP